MAIKIFKHLNNKSFTTNGVVLIVAAALILELISTIQYRYAREEIAVDLHLRAQSELLAKSLAIQNIMSQVESAVGNHVWDAERLIDYSDSTYSVVKRLVAQNPQIIGSSFTFEPNYYPKEGYWFESYAVRRDSDEIELVQLGGPDHDYTESEFFKMPYETGKARWTEPYLDSDGAKMILTTFSEPVKDKTGRVVAVLDADISLDWLKDILSVNYVYPSSYPILISRSGQIMSFPDKNYVMHKTLSDLASEKKDTTFLSMTKKMLAGESGNAVFNDNDGKKYHVFYAPVGGDTDWSLAVVSSEDEIFGQYNNMKKNLLLLRIIALVVLVFIIVRSVKNINRLQKITAERERIQGELNVAREIQMGMLPKNKLVNEGDGRVMIAGSLDPAKEVGGDLYDFFIKDDRLYFCIGDVSGKGVPASMFMTVTRSLFRTIAPYTQSASKVIWYMNRTMTNINETNMFVTFFVGILNLKNGELTYANAGHNGPVIIDTQGVRILNVIPNISLGVLEDFQFHQQTVILKPDTLLFLYTDGLTEAMNAKKEEYNERRMLAIIKSLYSQYPGLTPIELLEHVTADVKKFVDKSEQSDDLTMLGIKFTNVGTSTIKKEIVLKNKIGSVSILNHFIDEIALENAISDETAMEIKLAIEEAVVNVINYAYPPGEEGDIFVEFLISRDMVKIIIMDKGREFDPTKAPDVNVEASLDDRQIGGLGIFLLGNLTDSIIYSRDNDTNILTIEKYLKK